MLYKLFQKIEKGNFYLLIFYEARIKIKIWYQNHTRILKVEKVLKIKDNK